MWLVKSQETKDSGSWHPCVGPAVHVCCNTGNQALFTISLFYRPWWSSLENFIYVIFIFIIILFTFIKILDWILGFSVRTMCCSSNVTSFIRGVTWYFAYHIIFKRGMYYASAIQSIRKLHWYLGRTVYRLLQTGEVVIYKLSSYQETNCTWIWTVDAEASENIY